ncbi:MAG: aminoglycoside phosphotransferase family protein, partial [Desulfocapsaceae bacterium]|nr:aminoglycoside phosphotransferase family protein [Desulfocapsaceae bacterium]
QSALDNGETFRRVIHGDPKIDNVLFAVDSGRAAALIDLDTVSPGIPACDIGDCLRSYCNVLGEDPSRPGDVVFDTDICKSMLDGYRASGVSFPAGERHLVYEGVKLLTYELGLRFLTDYLNNNRYFKVDEDDKNLRRAVVQFILLNSIEQQQETIKEIAIQG